MNRFFLALMVILGVLGISTRLGKVADFPTPDQPLPTKETTDESLPLGQTIDISYQGRDYQLHVVEIPARALLRLIPNFKAKESGQNLVNRYNCTLAINGGFYKKDDTPLGFFVSEGERFGTPIQSNLVTGFFWQDDTGGRFISRYAPENLDHLNFVLQTGPLYLLDHKEVRIIDDEPARRSILGTTDDGKLYMIAAVEKNNFHSGPKLGDLPSIIMLPEVKKVRSFSSILNLDGGAASFFSIQDRQKSFMLSEITSIGSLFCVQLGR